MEDFDLFLGDGTGILLYAPGPGVSFKVPIIRASEELNAVMNAF